MDEQRKIRWWCSEAGELVCHSCLPATVAQRDREGWLRANQRELALMRTQWDGNIECNRCDADDANPHPAPTKADASVKRSGDSEEVRRIRDRMIRIDDAVGPKFWTDPLGRVFCRGCAYSAENPGVWDPMTERELRILSTAFAEPVLCDKCRIREDQLLPYGIRDEDSGEEEKPMTDDEQGAGDEPAEDVHPREEVPRFWVSETGEIVCDRCVPPRRPDGSGWEPAITDPTLEPFRCASCGAREERSPLADLPTTHLDEQGRPMHDQGPITREFLEHATSDGLREVMAAVSGELARRGSPSGRLRRVFPINRVFTLQAATPDATFYSVHATVDSVSHALKSDEAKAEDLAGYVVFKILNQDLTVPLSKIDKIDPALGGVPAQAPDPKPGS